MDPKKSDQGVLFDFMIPSDEEISRLRDGIRARVRAHVGANCQVVYDAFPFDETGRPVDNLDAIAVMGSCEFQQRQDPAWGDGSDYRSGVIRDPNWLQVAALADAMIRTTGDVSHRFLEGIESVGVRKGVQLVSFSMGS